MCKPYLRDSLLIQKAPRHQTPNASTYLWHHFLEGVHDSRALGLLEVGETTGDDDHGRQHHAQIQLKWGQAQATGGSRRHYRLSLVHVKACLSVAKKGICKPQNRFKRAKP